MAKANGYWEWIAHLSLKQVICPNCGREWFVHRESHNIACPYCRDTFANPYVEKSDRIMKGVDIHGKI